MLGTLTRYESKSRDGGGGGGTTATIATWLSRHRPMYERATRHPFIVSIGDGTVDFAAIKRWLGQDYIFVRELVPFVASVLLKSCKQSDDQSDVELILGGVASLNDEIAWFKKEASKWDGHLLTTAPQKANIDYCRFLQSLTMPEVSSIVAIVAFWAIETVYQESFAFCLESGLKTPHELTGTCRRWGNSGFAQYFLSLGKLQRGAWKMHRSMKLQKLKRCLKMFCCMKLTSGT